MDGERNWPYFLYHLTYLPYCPTFKYGLEFNMFSSRLLKIFTIVFFSGLRIVSGGPDQLCVATWHFNGVAFCFTPLPTRDFPMLNISTDLPPRIRGQIMILKVRKYFSRRLAYASKGLFYCWWKYENTKIGWNKYHILCIYSQGLISVGITALQWKVVTVL